MKLNFIFKFTVRTYVVGICIIVLGILCGYKFVISHAQAQTSGYSIVAAQNSVTVGGVVNASWTADIGSNNYDSILMVNINDSTITSWSGLGVFYKYSQGGKTSGTISFYPTTSDGGPYVPPGTYILEYYSAASNSIVATSQAFQVVSAQSGYSVSAKALQYRTAINSSDYIVLSWTAPTFTSGDYIALYPINTSGNTPAATSLLFTQNGSSHIIAPGVGTYEVRYMHADGTPAVAGNQIAVTAADPAYTVAAVPTKLVQGGALNANWTAAGGSNYWDSVEVDNINDPTGASWSIGYPIGVRNQASGTNTFYPSGRDCSNTNAYGQCAMGGYVPAGTYVLRYLNYNGDEVAFNQPFQIIAPQSGYSVSATGWSYQRTSINSGDYIVLSWTAPTFTSGDYIALYPINTSGNTPAVTYRVISANGHGHIIAPGVGTYEVRYMHADGTPAVAGNQIAVTAADPNYSVSPNPTTLIQGNTLDMNWTAAGGAANYDNISVANIDDPTQTSWSIGYSLNSQVSQTASTLTVYPAVFSCRSQAGADPNQGCGSASYIPLGTYVLRYSNNYGQTEVAFSQPFKVVAPSPTVTGQVIWTAVPTGGAGPYTYVWNGTDLPPDSTNPVDITSPILPATYRIRGLKTNSVTVTDVNGNQAMAQCILPVMVGDPPGAPHVNQTSSCDQNAASIMLSWDSVPNAIGYKIYDGATLLGKVITTNDTISNIPLGSTHSYTVVAYDDALDSLPSAPITYTAPSVCTPTQTSSVCTPYRSNGNPATGTIFLNTPITWKAFDQNNAPVSGTWAGTDVAGAPAGTSYPITYSTPGLKNMSVTVNGATSMCQFSPLKIIKLIFKEQ